MRLPNKITESHPGPKSAMGMILIAQRVGLISKPAGKKPGEPENAFRNRFTRTKMAVDRII
jgi:hypothetical protein